MEPPTLMALPADYTPAKGLYSRKYKRMKLSNDGKGYGQTGSSTSISGASDTKKPQASSRVRDYSDPFAVCNMLKSLDTGKYGSVTKEIEELAYRKTQLVNYYLTKYPSLSKMLPSKMLPDLEKSSTEEASKVSEEASKVSNQAAHVINLDDDDDDVVVVANHVASSASPIVIPDSDDEDNGDQRPLYPFQEARAPYPFLEALTQYPFQEVVLGKPKEEFLNKDIPIRGYTEASIRREEKDNLIGDIDIEKDKGLYVGVEDDADNQDEIADDGLGDIWKEMAIAIECSKEIVEEPSANEQPREDGKECDHSFMLKDDIGYVCCICGVIQRGIETIIEVQYNKAKRSTRTYLSDSRNAKDRDSAEIIGVKLSEDDSTVTNISAHPRHMNQMKPHQLEGFNFLCSNLVSESPGGCIMAHAPGSGKTFMIISFMQSFLAKYPYARPLVVLPKGILATWKKEFQTWQIEDIPLFDLYSVKADNRAQQLEVLKQWVEQKSILFLGYKQFSSIVCDDGGGKVSAACQEILLKAPSILILDEGHTPRNENTHVLQSLARVQTPRKVVLSGTLYQNHVKEVFNILNLVRPKFLRMHASKATVKRILSRVHITGVRKQFKTGGETAFYDLVEHTLQKDDNFKRKVSVIQDLREMTSKVLHYYKGDFLDELPGLVDFTVVLNLSTKQKSEVQKLKKKFERKFKIASVGSAVYLHPKLNSLSESSITTDYKMDEMLEKLDVRDGVKAKFFLNMINLCESAGEKLLVFSQYLVPLKFLERLAVKTRGWRPGREMFMISGESSAEHREWSMERFNNSPDAKVFFGSIKACGEGISLVGASRIIIVDVPLNPSVTRQAIGRAFRPGQKKKVYAYRLVAADSPEEEDHKACFKKELISKMWFEWNEYCGHRDFQVETIGIDQCGDLFLESSMLKEDVKVLYRR